VTIAVLIPAYNEAATIADIVRRATQHVAWVIVVDDCSSDDTAALAIEAGATVLRQANNQGKGAGLWRGMRYALEWGAAAILTLDADGQHRPEDMPKLLETYQLTTNALVIAARLEHRAAAPASRRFANAMADFWISWAAGCPIQDTQSGFRLYPAGFLKQIVGPQPGQYGFGFESALLIQAGSLGFYPKIVPIETIYPVQARSSYYQPWRDTWRIIKLVARALFLRGFYPVGLLRSLRLLSLPVQHHK
jgi:glycosyltransferase involved in cell wall biosynthesis